MRNSFIICLSAFGLFQTLAPMSDARAQGARPAELFTDGFESGTSGWRVSDTESIRVIYSGDPEHGAVLLLSPAGAQPEALILGSDRWTGYRIEGDVYFPDNRHNYLGLIYNRRDSGGRTDLGSIYIKGNGSYLQANPRRDWNPGRQLYGEYHVPLVGADSIRIGHWQRFAAEIVGHVCHFYVGDMTTPKMTFDLYEHEDGFAGFKPRVVGGPVWIDNIRVLDIPGLSYRGPELPAGLSYHPERLVTDWEVLGPFAGSVPDAERAGTPDAVVDRDGATHKWRLFETDLRGAVVTARMTDFLGERTVAYWRTSVFLEEGESARLEFSSIDNAAIWINGSFTGYRTGGRRAWYDFGLTPDREATFWVNLSPGENVVLIRVRGGQYATGGFFARVARDD